MCSGKAETPGDGRGLVEAYAIFGPASTGVFLRARRTAPKKEVYLLSVQLKIALRQRYWMTRRKILDETYLAGNGAKIRIVHSGILSRWASL